MSNLKSQQNLNDYWAEFMSNLLLADVDMRLSLRSKTRPGDDSKTTTLLAALGQGAANQRNECRIGIITSVILQQYFYRTTYLLLPSILTFQVSLKISLPRKFVIPFSEKFLSFTAENIST